MNGILMRTNENYNEMYFNVEDMGSCGTFVECKSCKWGPHQPDSHVIFGNTYCTYLKTIYNITFDEDGEVVCKLKSKKTKPRMTQKDRSELSDIVENITQPNNIDSLKKRIREMKNR